MKQLKKFEIPHKLRMLLQSPGFHRVLQLQNHYFIRYQQAKGFERFGIICIIVILTMDIFKVLRQIGAIGDILVFIAGTLSAMVVLTPIIMLILRYRWIKQRKKMDKILQQNHLQKYDKECIKLSQQIKGKKKA